MKRSKAVIRVWGEKGPTALKVKKKMIEKKNKGGGSNLMQCKILFLTKKEEESEGEC